MRGLITSDIFKMSKILKKMGLKITADETKSQKQVGADFILSIFENLNLAENEVTEFLGELNGITGSEFAKLPIEKTLEIIKEFQNISGLSGFLKQANQ